MSFSDHSDHCLTKAKTCVKAPSVSKTQTCPNNDHLRNMNDMATNLG